MTPAAIIARCLAQQAAADSRAALDYATGCSVGTVLALFAAGLLTDAECEAGTAAAREADRARRRAWDAAHAAALGADQPAPLPAEHMPAAADAYVVTAEADESGQRLYVAGPFASHAEADELAAALQEDADQWATDDPLLCTGRVLYRVELLADLPPVELPAPEQGAAPDLEPQAWGFLGLAYCLADCLGDSASNPPTPAERATLRGMAASAVRAWQAVHAGHGEELASLHAAARHAEQVGAHSVGAVSVELLRLLIGEGVHHG